MQIETQLAKLGIDPARCKIGPPVVLPARGSSGNAVARRIATPTKITFSVPGPPQAKPRMTRRDKWARRPCVLRYRAWCDLARSVAGDMPPANQVMALNWTAYFEPPASWSKTRRCQAVGTIHRSKPDRDNIDKAILDCFWPENDSGIGPGRLDKRWDWHARLEVEVVLG